jgi:hypothetical protein
MEAGAMILSPYYSPWMEGSVVGSGLHAAMCSQHAAACMQSVILARMLVAAASEPRHCSWQDAAVCLQNPAGTVACPAAGGTSK